MNPNVFIPNHYVSETQQAEYRSSKPEAAGSTPVAHFDFGWRIWDFGFVGNEAYSFPNGQMPNPPSQIKTGA